MKISRRKGIDFIFGKLRTVGALGILALMIVWISGVVRAGQSAVAASGARPHVVKLVIDGDIEPILAEYLDAGLDRAAEEHADLVLITMDTPGGLSDSMEDIIQHILRSPVPVAIYVEPAGSRGGVGGIFYFAFRGCGGDGAGHAYRRGVAAAGSWRLSGECGRHAEEENSE